MRCPSCGSLDTQVKDSRPTEESAVIRRRRVCLTCNFRFTTFERVQLRELTVIKRNGRRVPFDRDKLMRSVQIAAIMQHCSFNFFIRHPHSYSFMREMQADWLTES